MSDESSFAPATEGARTPWPEPGKVVLETRGLVRDLGSEAVKTRILHGIDLTIREGEFLSLTGFSGSGKSTLLYLLGALDRPTSGEVSIDGVEIGALDDDDRATLRGEKLGFVFQFHFLLPEFTVLENVMLPMKRRGARAQTAIESRAREVVESLGLGELAGRRPNQLSGGQQQRVSIARAVANDPRIVLADEPTGNLDSRNGLIVMDVFERLAREQRITIVMVTHERSFASRTSRQLVMKDGRIVEDLDQR
ncbi:MAG: ABC transporter ATP-binding protein [Deltaproteobacteria bacterium]|nr:ABC transporter ATP-binding protein [Deltaproteobacteria bacterium]